MELELKLHAQIQQLAHFFHNNQHYDPVLKISTTGAGRIKEVDLHYKNWLDAINLVLDLPDKPGLLVLRIFTTIINANGVHCRLHAVSGTIDMHNILNDGIASAPMANYRANSQFAPLQVFVRMVTKSRQPIVQPYNKSSLPTLGGQIQADLSMFAGMVPADEFLLKCHVPVYRVAGQVLPGAAYFSTHNTVDISHHWFMHMSSQIATRHGTTTAQWTKNIKKQFTSPPQDGKVSDEFHEAVGMALEIATAAVQSYEYVMDFFVAPSGMKEMYESFDNYFERRCGDCEGKLITFAILDFG